MLYSRSLALLVLLCVGCGSGPSEPDGGGFDGSTRDDAGPSDDAGGADDGGPIADDAAFERDAGDDEDAGDVPRDAGPGDEEDAGGACTVCAPGASEEQACGMCGTRSRSCGADGCAWGPYGVCTDEGVCESGEGQSQSCGRCGTRERTCDASCGWGSYGSCTGQGPCTPGQTQDQACGRCGTRERTCNGGCEWGSYGSCTGQGACTPGQTQTRSCDCGSGQQVRTCRSSCTWGSYGGCAGGDGYPVRPGTSTPVCPPYDRPAVFLAPHPDDESIGMAGAIAEHVASGRDTFIELMTHGRATGVRGLLNDGGTDAWHSGSHVYALTPDEVGDARLLEFIAAAQALGVDGIRINDYGDGNLTTGEVTQRINFWRGLGQGGLSLKGTAGLEDPTSAGGQPHRDHRAVWDALIGSGFADVRGYLVYHYTSGAGSADRIDDITPWCQIKRNALAAYRVWSPGTGRYAIGYHSVSALIDTASSDCREFVVFP